MLELPTQEQIDDIMRRAHADRSRAMLDSVHWIGRQFAAPFRNVLVRPADRRS